MGKHPLLLLIQALLLTIAPIGSAETINIPIEISVYHGNNQSKRSIIKKKACGTLSPTLLCSSFRNGGNRELNKYEQYEEKIKKNCKQSIAYSSFQNTKMNIKARQVKLEVLLSILMKIYLYNKQVLLYSVYLVCRPDNSTKGRILLTIVAFMYGTLKVTLRRLYALPEPPSASAVSFIRGWLTVAAFYIIQLLQNRNKELNQHSIPTSLQNKVESIVEKAQNRANISVAETLPHFWISVIELSIWNFASTSLANIGLLYTESARASFLIQTSVLFTPLISVITGQMVSKTMWLGCGIVLSGLLLLAASKASSSTAPIIFFQSGDMFLLGGAFCWSMYLFRMSKIGKMKSKGSMLLTWKTIFVALLYSCWLFSSMVARRYEVSTWREVLHALWAGYRDWKAWALLALSAIFPGAIADLLQQQGQKEVSATEANVLLSSEPIFTAMLSYLILGESTTIRENVGGALIVLGAIVASKHKKH